MLRSNIMPIDYPEVIATFLCVLMFCLIQRDGDDYNALTKCYLLYFYWFNTCRKIQVVLQRCSSSTRRSSLHLNGHLIPHFLFFSVFLSPKVNCGVLRAVCVWHFRAAFWMERRSAGDQFHIGRRRCLIKQLTPNIDENLIMSLVLKREAVLCGVLMEPQKTI